MSDEHLRVLERRFAETGDLRDEIAWIGASIKTGEAKPGIPGLDLHDSVIDYAAFDAEQQRLTFGIDLCAWRQLGYSQPDPELVAGSLVFAGVTDLQLDSPEGEVLSREWWAARGGSFLQADQTASGYRLIFEVAREDNPEALFCMVDLSFSISYFAAERGL